MPVDVWKIIGSLVIADETFQQVTSYKKNYSIVEVEWYGLKEYKMFRNEELQRKLTLMSYSIKISEKTIEIRVRIYIFITRNQFECQGSQQ